MRASPSAADDPPVLSLSLDDLLDLCHGMCVEAESVDGPIEIDGREMDEGDFASLLLGLITRVGDRRLLVPAMDGTVGA